MHKNLYVYRILDQAHLVLFMILRRRRLFLWNSVAFNISS